MTVTVDRAQETIDTVHDLLAQFDAEYADVLPAVSAQYFHANERLTDRQRDFVQALLHLGSSVNSIAAEHVDTMLRDPEAFERRDAAFQRRAAAKDRLHDLSDSFDQQRSLLKEYAQQQQLSKRDIKELHDELVETYQDEYGVRERVLFGESETAYMWHAKTYGAAFRSALQDVGVVFANGKTAFEQIVTNAEELQTVSFVIDDHHDALNYYPSAWVNRIHFPLKVYMAPRMFHGGVYFRDEDATFSPYMLTSDSATTVHEWGHIMEIANPLIGRAERLFIMFEREVTGFGAVRQFEDNQYVVADSLIHEYAGVYYRGRSHRTDHVIGHIYEALTTGAESLFLGRFGGLTTDPNHYARRHADFLLGLYAVLGR